MKIAVFHNVRSGGAKRTIYEQVKRLSRRHTIDLFSLTSAEHKFGDLITYVGRAEILPFQPLPVYQSPFGRLNQAVRTLDLLRLRQVMNRLAAMIDAGDYDVALVQPCMFTFSPTILRHLRLASLYYRHDPVRWVQDPQIPRPYHKLNRRRQMLDRLDPLRGTYYRLLVHEDLTSMRAATGLVTNSYFMRETIYRLFGTLPNVCYHGVDSQLFRPLGLERGTYVLSVGAIAPYKGYDFLIRSLSYIAPASRPGLILVGNAVQKEEQQYLASLASEFGIKVEFRHMISNDELVCLYNRALCTVYAPFMEPFGLVPLESMACGTPVVGIQEGGVRETVVHGVTGLLADRDEEQFAGAISTLLEDRNLLEHLGREGRCHIEKRWDWDDAVVRLESQLVRVADRC
jgi:glycosyltransferase involved in cell wall biosynthesis